MPSTREQRVVRLHELRMQGVQFDDADFELLANHMWRIDVDGYVKTNDAPHRKSIAMHKVLLGPTPAGKQADHEDRDKLNNRRHNLRFISYTNNILNSYGRECAANVRPYQNGYRVQIQRQHVYLDALYKTEAEAMAAATAFAFAYDNLIGRNT